MDIPGETPLPLPEVRTQTPTGGHARAMYELYRLHCKYEEDVCNCPYQKWIDYWYCFYMQRYAGRRAFPVPDLPYAANIMGRLQGIHSCPLQSFIIIPLPSTIHDRQDVRRTRRFRDIRSVPIPAYLYLTSHQRLQRKQMQWVQVYSKTVLQPSLYYLTINTWHSNRGVVMANGVLQIQDQGPWYILLTNVTCRSIRLCKDTCLASITPDTAILQDADLLTAEVPPTLGPTTTVSRWQRHFADIRINATYLRYIAGNLNIDKLQFFPEAFYMGGDYESQRWRQHAKLWINPRGNS